MSEHFDPILWTISLSLCLGLVSYLLSQRFQLSPIIFFLLFGFIFGPEGFGLLFPGKIGDAFKTIISVGIAVILFEAGLTLDYSEYKKTSRVIWRLLSIGVIITWVGNALAIYFIFNLPIAFSFFSSSLIIVTGPTVIMPILRRIRVNKKLFNILHWEGVLIDPIGVFIATLSLEILLYWPTGSGIYVALNLLQRLFFGTFFGLMFGILASQCIKRRWISSDYMNIFVLVMAIFTFSVCDFFVSESGLLATVIAGIITGFKKNVQTEEVKRFKLEVTHLSIALLFILIVSSLEVDKILAMGNIGVILLIIIIFVVRPLNILFSTLNSDLTFKEKLFLSWVSPRGIVAASMSTLFAIYLAKDGGQYSNFAWFAETLTFSVIFTTVLLQGITAEPIAKLLKVQQTQNREWVIIGAHEFSEKLYLYLTDKGYDVILIDNNGTRVDWYKKKGLNVIKQDVLSSSVYSDERFFNSSTLVSLTDNEDLNALICQHWKNLVPRDKLYRWEKEDSQDDPDILTGYAIWQGLPKPSIVSSELIEGKVELIEKKYSEHQDKDIPLLYFYNDNIYFQIEEDILQNLKEANKIICLFFCREVFKLCHYFKKELVMFCESDDIKKLYENIAYHFENTEKLDSQNLLKEMVAKHEDGSISLGNNTGIMHVLNRKINKPVLGVVISQKGLDCNSYDKLPCKILFILISPSGDPDRHVWMISTLSQLFLTTNIKQQLLECRSLDEVTEVISKYS